MRSFLYTTLIVGLVASIAAQDIQAVGDLFNVDFTTNNQGGCSYVGQINMQNILQDSYDLSTIGIQLVSDYENNVAEARRLIDSFFQVQNPPMTAAQLEEISAAYTDVSNWLLKGGPYDDGERKNQPFLFCFHSWLQKKNMNDPALDENGETFPNVLSGGAVALIRDVPEYVEMQERETQEMKLATPAAPYWSYKHNAYIFDRSYGNINTGICSNPLYEGATQHVLDPSTITLCPRSFGTVNARRGISYVGRRSVAPNPIPRSTIPSATGNSQILGNVVPTAGTFFHELFHLVLGDGLSRPSGGEVYGLLEGEQGDARKIVGLNYDDAVLNPESYTLASIAYDYTLNWPPDNAGNRIEFEAGYTTQG